MSETLINRMKPIAAHLPAAVAARDRKTLDALLAGAPTVRELRALIVLLAECADPARLAEATDWIAPLEPHVAHMIFARLRSDHAWHIPGRVREGERAYQAACKRAQRRAVA